MAKKDLDLIQTNHKFDLGKEDSLRVKEALRKDCEFFERQGIIDYSLLVGEHTVLQIKTVDSISIGELEHPVPSVLELSNCKDNPNVLVSSDKKKVYFMGIIDILTQFNNKKRMPLNLAQN